MALHRPWDGSEPFHPRPGMAWLPWQRSTQIRRDRIARALLELVANQGMKGIDDATLAHRVGAAPSATHHHFKGKDEVLDTSEKVLLTRDGIVNGQEVCRLRPHRSRQRLGGGDDHGTK